MRVCNCSGQGSHQTNVLSIDQFPQPHVLNPAPTSSSHSLQVMMQAIPEQANRVAMSVQPCRNPIEGVLPSPLKPETLMESMQLSYKDCTAPIMLHPPAAGEGPQQWPLHPGICRIEVQKRRYKGDCLCFTNVLQNKRLIDDVVLSLYPA